MSVSATRTTIAGRISRNIWVASSGEMQGRDHEVDGLDADKWNNHAAKAVDQKVAAEQPCGSDRTIAHALKRQRNKGDDKQRIEDNRRKDGALGSGEPHDVQRLP